MNFRPIFVIGLARSGTNLLARMLDRHSHITVALDPLLPLFRALRNSIVAAQAPPDVAARFDPSGAFQDYYFASDETARLDCILDCVVDGKANLEIDRDALGPLQESVVARTALESPLLAQRMTRLAGVGFAELLRSALTIIGADKPEAAWVGTKEVWIFEFVPLLARLFPAARFYAIERDPRAIVASLIAMAARDPSQAAHPPSYLRHWRKSIALARRFASDPLLSKRFRAVSYEHLVAEPEVEARRLCAELDLPFEPTMIALSADGWRGNSSYAQTERDVYASSTAAWRDTLAPEIARTAEFFCAPEMTLTDYRAAAPPLDAGILDYLARAGRAPGSWRSDSGDLLADLGGELLRHALLDTTNCGDDALARRCFLFKETYDAIRSKRGDFSQ